MVTIVENAACRIVQLGNFLQPSIVGILYTKDPGYFTVVAIAENDKLCFRVNCPAWTKPRVDTSKSFAYMAVYHMFMDHQAKTGEEITVDMSAFWDEPEYII